MNPPVLLPNAIIASPAPASSNTPAQLALRICHHQKQLFLPENYHFYNICLCTTLHSTCLFQYTILTCLKEYDTTQKLLLLPESSQETKPNSSCNYMTLRIVCQLKSIKKKSCQPTQIVQSKHECKGEIICNYLLLVTG